MSTDTAIAEAPAEAVGPLIRGIGVIRALTEAGRPCTAPDLARQVGLARASLDRILATLAELDYVRVAGRDVTLAPPLLALGNAYLHSVRIPTLLGPLAEALSDRLDEVVTLTVVDDDRVYVVHEAVRPRALVIACHVGDELPIDRCAVGVLAASTWDDDHWARFANSRPRGADDLRRRVADAGGHDWALDDQWLEPGLVAVAVPVPAPDGGQACTVNVLSFTSRHATAADLAAVVLPAVRESVRHMADALGTAPADRSLDVHPVESGPATVESLARGLNVLAAFGPTRPHLTIADAARVTGLPRATVRRALITLEHLGYVTQTHGHYRPRAAVLSLGHPVLSRLTLAQIATPHLEALSARIGDAVSLAVPHGDTEIMYRARAATPERLTTVDVHIGTRRPAAATAMGRVLLAARPTDEPLLRRIRADGYAVVDEELEAGLRSIAVPVPGHDGTTLAAVNVAMHAGRGAAQVTEILPPLRAAADAIHRDLVAIGTFHRLTMM